jgi:hypothetical protein
LDDDRQPDRPDPTPPVLLPAGSSPSGDPERHRHRRVAPPRDDRTWLDIGREQLHRPAIAAAAGALVMLVLVGLVALAIPRSPAATSTGPAPAALPPTVVAGTPAATPSAVPAPPVPDPSGNPGPAVQPGSPPVASAQSHAVVGVNAQALLDEMRKHYPPLTDDDAAKLVAIGDQNVLRGQADLQATDPQIRAEVDQAFPTLPVEVRVTMTSCTAEYVERVIAMNNHTTPPDERDDHTVKSGN